jgi:hypothetical protein
VSQPASHDPIMIVINRKLCMNQNYGGKVHTHRIKWNKDDLNEYEKFVETESLFGIHPYV